MSINHKFFVLFVVVMMAVVLSACGGSDKPQPVCASGKTAVVDSVSANNPFGVCKDAKGNMSNGEKSFAQYFSDLKNAAEKTNNCYANTGMGTSCLSATINSK